MKIRVVSFDGLNRSGKGIQTSMLEDYLSKSEVFTVTMRGDGSRKGNGSKNDPYSVWWQNLQPHLRKIDENGNFNKKYWDRASSKLNSEIYDMYYHEFPNKINESKFKEGSILLDRSVISRYFVKKRENPNIKFEDVTRFYDKSGVIKNVILPDLAFVIHVPKDVLLERNEQIADHPDKYYFRKKIITGYYESFEAITKEISSDLIQIVHLDGDKSPESVFKEIIHFYEKYRG